MEGGEMQGAAQRMLPWPITPKCPWSRGSPKAPAPPWVVLPVCQGAAISFVQLLSAAALGPEQGVPGAVCALRDPAAGWHR